MVIRDWSSDVCSSDLQPVTVIPKCRCGKDTCAIINGKQLKYWRACREKRKEYAKKTRERDPQHYAEYRKKYYAEHKAKHNEYMLKYYYKNSEKRNAYMREWKRKQKTKIAVDDDKHKLKVDIAFVKENPSMIKLKMNVINKETGKTDEIEKLVSINN